MGQGVGHKDAVLLLVVVVLVVVGGVFGGTCL